MVDQALADSGFLQRVEQTFKVEDLTQSRLEEWLLHKKKPGAGLSSQTKRLARKLSETGDIYSDSQKEFDITQIPYLERLKKRAADSPVYREDLLDNIDEKLGIAREEERITKEIQSYSDKIDDIRGLPMEEQKRLYKEGNREERALAGVAIGRENFRVLGGLVSGESRRRNAALRRFFG